ncbi:MAG: ADP-ribosylglycohydrolase family protein, partial [Bacteroidales bacterium]|nr:ADP-ribosylglycohydrolase family protein [Bacteroidales bacterium]
MKRRTFIFVFAAFFCANNFQQTVAQKEIKPLKQPAQREISLDVLHDKIAGAWIGQMIGNIYGLSFENKFIENSGDEKDFPYGYTKNTAKLQKYNGAFSDDDTDIEYIYLMLMEKYGIEPTYAQMREGWMYHIRDRVWLANRAALGLMHYGYTPPFTGSREINPHWYQIDPQLINEIWGYTAPGMLSYAAEKSAWAARITSDDWAISPTIHYGVMYANAFFEKDIRKLIENALTYLPAGDRYAATVREMLALYDKYPNDWTKAREEMATKYYVNEQEMTKTIWNANLNGACGILSMLYGRGDFQRTMDLGCAMGFDADNQTATVGGILGVMYGASYFPDELTKPIEGWTEPFNDRYINITRHDMPDASIKDMISRTYEQALKTVQYYGGKIVNDKLIIKTSAKFNPPLEFCIGPMPRLEVGKACDYSFASITNAQYKWTLKSGALPEGLTFVNGRLSGTPAAVGKYPITLTLSDGKQTIEKTFELLVRARNIAVEADSIIANVRETNKDVLYKCWTTFGKPIYASSVNIINDGILHDTGAVFYSLAAEAKIPKIDYFG